VSPQWRIEDGGILLQLRVDRRIVAGRVKSVASTSWGLRVLYDNRREKMPAELLVFFSRKSGGDEERLRYSFRKSLCRWLENAHPGCRVLSFSKHVDRSHTISARFLRVLMRYGNRDYLALASEPDSTMDESGSLLTQALLWLALLRSKKSIHRIPIMYLLVPVGHAGIPCHRAQFLDPELLRVEIFEYEAGLGDMTVRRPLRVPVPREDRDFHWPLQEPFGWSDIIGEIISLAPGMIRRHPRLREYESLRILGLEFARIHGPERDRVLFGVGSQKSELTDGNIGALRELIDEILYYRRPDCPLPSHPYYRMQAERWFECLILDDIRSLFPEFAPGCVYTQIPVYLGSVHGRVDILGADLDGTLVVVELKVTEDPGLPLQSLDYWGRVIRHNLEGDFSRRGYFTRVSLRHCRPRIYLAAPIFSFHSSTEEVLSYLQPEIEVWKIAVNEDWRAGVRLLRRTRLR
jgi:hypothetical protein